MKVRISYTVDVDKNERLVLGTPCNEKLATREKIRLHYKYNGVNWREHDSIAEYEKGGPYEITD